MKILSREEMEKLSTKRLLAYKKKLLQVDDASRCWCGSSSGNCDYRQQELLKHGAFIKASPAWQELYKNVKEVLNTREHVERK